MESQKKKLTELSDEDNKQIDRDRWIDPVYRYLANVDGMQFNVGDILNRQYKGMSSHGNATWITEQVSDVCRVPVKYVYVHKNDQGIGYIKRLMANGKGTTSRMFSISSVDLTHQRFVIDQEYADHVLMTPELEFDCSASYKQSKSKNRKAVEYNKNNSKKFDTIDELKEFFRGCSIGQELYIKQSWGRTYDRCLITAMDLKADIKIRLDMHSTYGTRTAWYEGLELAGASFMLSKPIRGEDL